MDVGRGRAVGWEMVGAELQMLDGRDDRNRKDVPRPTRGVVGDVSSGKYGVDGGVVGIGGRGRLVVFCVEAEEGVLGVSSGVSGGDAGYPVLNRVLACQRDSSSAS